MIKIKNTEVVGWGHAIRGMRNPLNSWGKMDSHECDCGEHDVLRAVGGTAWEVRCPMYKAGHEPAQLCNGGTRPAFCIGKNDHALMMRLAQAGPEHAKYRRMIVVYANVTAPLYWWKEYDTYKVGTVANSCSTMHKIHSKRFELADFSHEHLTIASSIALQEVIYNLNYWRAQHDLAYTEKRRKECWWQLIQLLPSSYTRSAQSCSTTRFWLTSIASAKATNWTSGRSFCKWIEQLPYSELITGKESEENG